MNATVFRVVFNLPIPIDFIRLEIVGNSVILESTYLSICMTFFPLVSDLRPTKHGNKCRSFLSLIIGSPLRYDVEQ